MAEPKNPIVTSIFATLHCMTGCVIGEILGLLVGVSMGLDPLHTMALAVLLAYLFGFGLTIRPLMKVMTFKKAFKIVWVGETISIGVMEIAMNAVDYAIGGVQSGSIFSALFWIGLLAAIPAGFLAAWPVNYWLIKRSMKSCH